MRCITSRACITSEMFSFSVFCSSANVIVSGGGFAQNTVQNNCWNLVVGTLGSRTSRILPGGNLFPSRHPSLSFLTSCSSATVSVSGGGPPVGRGRRGHVFDLLCRYQKVSYKSNQAMATNVVATRRFRTSLEPSHLSEVFAQAPLSELFIATVSDFLM